MSAQKRPSQLKAEGASAKRVRIDGDPSRMEEDEEGDSIDGEFSADMSQIPTQDLQPCDTPTRSRWGVSC